MRRTTTIQYIFYVLKSRILWFFKNPIILFALLNQNIIFDKAAFCAEQDSGSIYVKHLTVQNGLSENEDLFVLDEQLNLIKNYLPQKTIYSIFIDSKNSIWVATQEGIYNSNDKQQFVQIPILNEQRDTLRIRIATFKENVSGDIIAGSFDRGWYVKHPYNQTFQPVRPPWYKSTLANFFFTALLLALLFCIYFFLKRRWVLKAMFDSEHQKALQLKTLSDFKTRLFTDITHELKTPLALILGPTRSALKQLPNLNKDELQKHLQVVEKNSVELLSRINNILYLNKLEGGMINSHCIVGDLIQFIEEIVTSFQKLADSKNVKLLFNSAVNNVVVKFDKNKIYAIITNLLSNAIKFTDIGGYVKVNIFKKSNQQQLCIEVSDTGIGVPFDEIPFIFDRFYQSKQNPKYSIDIGSGIGLALVKELVEVLQGTIEAKNNKEKGMSFMLTLPIKSNNNLSNADITTKENEEEEERFSENGTQAEDKPILLIVDDEVEMRDYIASILAGKYQIIYASNGKDGFDMAITQIPDLIILDVVMPIMDGFQTSNLLKSDQLTSHIPVIMLTAQNEPESKLKALQSKIDAFLTKPFYEDELLLRVENLIQRHEMLKQRYANLEEQNEVKTNVVNDAMLNQLTKYIESELSNSDLEVTEICKALHISRTQLHRKLKSLTGLSATQFVRNVRLKKAKLQLKNTDLNITEVAYDCGFKTLSYFTRIFSKETGQSPTEYRNANSV